MKKKYRQRKKINLIALLSVLVCLFAIFLTVGFSSFQTSMDIADISNIVRLQSDIRVTGVNVSNATSEVYSSYDEYNVNSIYSSVYLPYSNSTVTYEIEVTNLGGTIEGIYAIDEIYKIKDTTNNSNLEIKSKTVNLKEALCDSTYNTQCMLGSVTTFYITIGYETNGFDNINKYHTIELDFDFRRVYNITYEGFSGNTTGLISWICSDGGTITFDSTTGIPNSVTVTGAVYDNYNTTKPNLVLTSVTGDVTIKAVNQVTTDMAYTTLLNIYNNSIHSTDSSCDNTLTLDNTSDHNLRFIGSKPCNYVYFNCSNPNNPTSSTCEKWRIIGVFNRNNKSVLKIINSSFYNNKANVQFNSSNTVANRIWGTNTLSDTFNNTSSPTSYYNAMASSDNHNYIESVNWPVGTQNSTTVKLADFYSAENVQLSSSSLPFGLLNLTDINYGTSNTSCWNTNMSSWNSSCMEKSSVDWMFEGVEYTLSVYSDNSYYVYKMQNTYIPYRTQINSSLPARIVTHLKTNVYFDGGDGSSNSPYILKIHN